MSAIKYPTVDELVELNRTVLREIRVKKADRHQVLSRKALEEVLERVKGKRGDIYDKAVLLLTEIVTKHPFASGVRRTAFMAALSFLEINGKSARVAPDPKVLQGIREGFYTVDEIKTWLKGRVLRKFER